MIAKGTFVITLTPQNDDIPVGRMTIEKIYSGDLVGTGKGQMISKRTESGTAIYSAIEEVECTLDGYSGGFTLHHQGFMSAEKQILSIKIIEGSGFGDFSNKTGEMSIMKSGDVHKYELVINE